MTKENIINQLETIFQGLVRYEDENKQWKFVQKYFGFLALEEKYIPKVIDRLYKKNVISDEYMVIWSGMVHAITGGDIEGGPFYKKELHDGTHEYSPDESGVSGFNYDIEDLHVNILEELRSVDFSDVKLESGILWVDGYKVDLTQAGSQLSLMENILLFKLGQMIDFEEMYNKMILKPEGEYKNKWYQYGREINTKVLESTGKPRFLDITKKYVRVNI